MRVDLKVARRRDHDDHDVLVEFCYSTRRPTGGTASELQDFETLFICICIKKDFFSGLF